MNGFNMLRALVHRNFRLFFVGQGISLIGTWMQQVAMSWLVYQKTQQTGSGELWLGIVGFCGQMPSFFLAPVAGVLVDHWNRHRLIILTQTLAMLQAFALAFLDLGGIIEIWHVVVLSIVMGLINAFDMPARQAFLTEMIDRREDLANAIALNSSMVNGARLVGPAVAGLLLAVTSAGVCFLVNALSFLAVLASLLAMRVTPRQKPLQRPPLLRGLREGFHYAFGFAPIRAILLLLAVVSLTGMSYSILMPVFAVQVLHGDERTGPLYLGLLSAGAGVGALTGALFLANRPSVLGLGKWLVLTPALFGGALIAFGFSQEVWLSVVLLMVAGFAMMVQMAASNTLLQTIVEEDKRGRVMSFYTMAFIGMAPVGSLLAGSLAQVEWIGAQKTVMLAGACCMVAAVVFGVYLERLRTLIRPIYQRLGILPEVASGIQAATELAVPPEEG